MSIPFHGQKSKVFGVEGGGGGEYAPQGEGQIPEIPEVKGRAPWQKGAFIGLTLALVFSLAMGLYMLKERGISGGLWPLWSASVGSRGAAPIERLESSLVPAAAVQALPSDRSNGKETNGKEKEPVRIIDHGEQWQWSR